MGRRTLNVIADTNVLLRAVVLDDPVQSSAAISALREAAIVAITTEALCEFVWVLTRGYKTTATDVLAAVKTLLAAGNVTADRAAIAHGIRFLKDGSDFADGVIAYKGTHLGGDVFLSFDRNARKTAMKLGQAAATP